MNRPVQAVIGEITQDEAREEGAATVAKERAKAQKK